MPHATYLHAAHGNCDCRPLIIVCVQLEVRSSEGGEVLFRDQLPKAVVHVAAADFRNNGTNQILVCLASGELRGYVVLDAQSLSKPMQDQSDIKILEQVQTSVHFTRFDWDVSYSFHPF
jgi:hypothetical protein